MQQPTKRRISVASATAFAKVLMSFAAVIGAVTALITKTDSSKSRAAYNELKAAVQADHDRVVVLGATVALALSATPEPGPIEMGALVVTVRPDAGAPVVARPTIIRVTPVSGAKKPAAKGIVKEYDEL